MKGFKDEAGKFRPVSNTKGIRKKSDKTRETSGMQMSTGIRKKRQQLQRIDLKRQKGFEGGKVKFALEDEKNGILATLVDGDFPDEMEIRISTPDDRFSVVGHRSIMDDLTLDQFRQKVLLQLDRHESFSRKKRDMMQKGLKEWGFDLTNFEPNGFQKVLMGVGIQEGDMTIDNTGRLLDGTPYRRGFIWKGEGIEIETSNNPITGEYVRPEQREPEKDYASYIGITGEPEKVATAVKLIKQLSGNKDESPNRREFI